MEVITQPHRTFPSSHMSSHKMSAMTYQYSQHQQAVNAADLKLPSIRDLLTPPNSGDANQFNDSFKLSSPIDDKHDPTIFGHSSGSESGSVTQSPLFSASRHTPPASDSSSEPDLYPDSDDKSAIQGHQSQFNWRKLHVLEPSVEDYQLCATFYRDFSRLGWVEHPEHANQPPPSFSSPYNWYRAEPTVVPPRRKVLHDASPNRRSPMAGADKPSSKRTSAPSSVPSKSKSRPQDRSQRQKSSSKGGETGGSVSESKSARAKSTKPATDSNYRNYPDFSPPFDAMERPVEYAQATKRFAGQFIDSTNDAERELLHEAEIIAAEHLSLPCAKYLCTKRQIFQAYVKHLQTVNAMRKAGSAKIPSWNKTEAQRKCNVDVNKASQLWQFFHDIGWFKEKHFQQYLNVEIPSTPLAPTSTSTQAGSSF